MSHTAAEISVVPTRITNVQELLAGMGKVPHRHRIKTVFRTFAFTAANPVQPVLGEDLSRVKSYAQALGNSVVLCESESQAQGVGNVTGLANPDGALLYVDAAATGLGGGLAAGQVFPIHTNDVMWAVAVAFPAYLVLTINSQASGY